MKHAEDRTSLGFPALDLARYVRNSFAHPQPGRDVPDDRLDSAVDILETAVDDLKNCEAEQAGAGFPTLHEGDAASEGAHDAEAALPSELQVAADANTKLDANGGLGETAPAPPHVIDTVRVGNGPVAVAATVDAVWVTNMDDATVSRIDPSTNEVVDTIQVGAVPVCVIATADALWVTDALVGAVGIVWRIDLATNGVSDITVTATTIGTIGYGTGAVAATTEAVWVASLGGTVSRIDPSTNEVVDTIHVSDVEPYGIAATIDAVWVTSGTVTRIDPRTNEVTSVIEVGEDPEGVAVTVDAVWVANNRDGTVSRIDPATNTVTDTISVGNEPEAVAATSTAIWVANCGDGTVSRIDPGSG